MTFRKLALATAVAAIPVAGFSAETLDDAFLSGVTGQDGIAINISTPAITTDIVLHDTDGIQNGSGAYEGSVDFTGVTGGAAPVVHTSASGIKYVATGQSGDANVDYTYTHAGAIVIEGFSFSGSLDIEIDAGDAVQTGPAGSAAVLNVAVNLGATTIGTGGISVANSQRDDATPGWDFNAGTQTATILESVTISLNSASLNIQLGNEPQGHMIVLDTVIGGGLTLSNVALNDAGGAITGGSLGAATVAMVDVGGTDLTVAAGVDADASGLVVTLDRLGSLASGMNVQVTDAYLGDGTAIVGDVFVKNLQLGGTVVTISGK